MDRNMPVSSVFPTSWSLFKFSPLSWWCYLTISSSVAPFSFCLQSFPAPRSFPMSSSLYQVAKVLLELLLQHQSFQWIFRVDFLLDWLAWSPCCPRDSQESSLAPQFQSINLLVLSLFYGGKGAGHNPWKNDIAWGHNINQWLESNEPKMADKSTSMTRLWSSISKLNDIPRGAMTVPMSTIKRPKSGWWPNSLKSPPLPQNSWNIPPSLAYEITQPVKANHAIFQGCTHPLQWSVEWNAFFSEWIHFLSITLSLTEFFLWWDIKNLNFIRSWNQVCDFSWKTMDFGWVWVQTYGLDYQTGLWLGLSPDLWVQVPIWGRWYHNSLIHTWLPEKA